MKIALFTGYFLPHLGGIEVVSGNQAKALANAGQEVRVVTSACSSRPGVAEIDGYRIRRLRAWNITERKLQAAFPIFSPSLLWHSYDAVRQTDIVHVHDAFYISSFWAAFWARLLHKPLVLTQHVDIVSHPSKLILWAQKLVYATTGKFIIKSSSKIIVLNSRVKQFLLNMHVEESKIVFLPNSVDTVAFSPVSSNEKRKLRRKYHLPADRPLALFVGRFVPKKGFIKLAQLQPIDKLAFVFVGGYSPTKTTRDDHFYLGAIDRNAIADIFKLCDIFVLPSEGEGFPVTIQEAMASGLPVLTTADTGYDIYKLDKKSLAFIQPDDALIQLLLALVADKERQDKMSAYSRRYAVKNFNGDKITQKLISIYDGVSV